MVTTSAHTAATDEITGSVGNAIRKLVMSRLRHFGAEDVRIEPGEDHHGDPVVFVHVRHRLIDDPVDLKVVIANDRELRDLAWQKGERRFVHVRHHFDENQSLAGD